MKHSLKDLIKLGLYACALYLLDDNKEPWYTVGTRAKRKVDAKLPEKERVRMIGELRREDGRNKSQSGRNEMDMMPEMCLGGFEPEEMPVIEAATDWRSDEDEQAMTDALLNPPTFTIEVETDLKVLAPSQLLRVHSRKRFVKMLMACGESRNTANASARLPRLYHELGWGVSYAAWFNTLVMSGAIRVDKICRHWAHG